jgi:hypothetical protein
MKEQLQQALAAVKAGDEAQARVHLAQLLQEDPDNVAGWVLLSKLSANTMQKITCLRKVLDVDPDHAYARRELSRLEAAPPGVSGSSGEADGGGEAEAPAEPAEEETVPEVSAETPAVEDMGAETEQDIVTGTAGEVAEETPAAGEEAEEVEEVEEPLPDPFVPISDSPFDYEAQAEGDTLPPWMEDDEAAQESLLAAETPAVADEDVVPMPEVPDWVMEEPDEDWLGLEEELEMELQRAAEAEAREAEAPGAEGEVAREEEAEAPLSASALAEPAAAAGERSQLLAGLALAAAVVFLILVYLFITLFF